MSVLPYKGQKYSILKKQALSSGQPFEDPEFARSERSLFYTSGAASGIEWKRPREISSDPHLFTEGISSHDLVQGELGNCWLVAACSCLALHKSLWSQVIPDYKEQEWSSGKDHPGIFHFRFWRYGVWIDVVIDDYLPTRRGQLIYLRSPDKNEFWSALLEKAYAKLFGCYEALSGGELAEALADFTGGVSETIDLQTDPLMADEDRRDQFYDWLVRTIKNNGVMCASINVESASEMEKPTEMGLVKGHAYSVTAVRKVTLEGTGIFNLFNREKLAMVRLRNPWGDSEWTGAFSDGSEEWQKITKSDREKIGLTFDNDGEFWMTFDDFSKHFKSFCVCHQVNTSIFSFDKRWYDKQFSGAWVKPHRAGGCANNRETFFNNPQYMFTVTDNEDELMFELSQQTSRQQNAENLSIGVTALKVESNREYRVHTLHTKVGSSAFRNSRTVFWRNTFTPGRYVLVVCTFDPDLEGEFLLRCFAGQNVRMKELTADKPAKPWFCPCLPACRYPQCVTSVKIVKAEGLHRKDQSAAVDAYCIMSCERTSVRTSVIKNTQNPEWNTSAVFYRRAPRQKPLKFEIWHKTVLGSDECLGTATYDNTDETPATATAIMVQVPVVVASGKRSSSSQAASGPAYNGRVTIEVTTRRKLDAL